MEAIKQSSYTAYKLMTGFCIALICEKVGIFNAIAGVLAMFIMAE